MNSTVNVLFWIGLLTSLLKAGDLLLSEETKRRVQSASETVTLWLEDLRPVSWLRPLTSRRAHVILLLIGICELLVFLGVTAATGGWSPSSTLREKVSSFGVIILSLVSLPLIVRRFGPKMMNWLLQDLRPGLFLARFLLLTLAGSLIFLAYVFLAIGVAESVGNLSGFDDSGQIVEGDKEAEWIFLGGMLLIWPAFIYFWILTQVGFLVLWFSLIVLILELLLKVVRGLAWRVVEYTKGAYAALLLVVTAALGIVHVFLKGS